MTLGFWLVLVRNAFEIYLPVYRKANPARFNNVSVIARVSTTIVPAWIAR